MGDMNHVTIKEFDINDYEGVYRLWGQIFSNIKDKTHSKENVEKFLHRNRGLSFIAIEDNRFVGTILGATDGWRGYIYHLCVEQKSRRKGIARQLISRTTEALRNAGVYKVNLFVYKDNAAVRSLYCNNGFMLRNELEIYSRQLDE